MIYSHQHCYKLRRCYVGINDNQKEKRTNGEVTGLMIS